MVYVFEDGRVLVSDTKPEGRCLEVLEYPVPLIIEGKSGYIAGCDLDKKEVLFEYADEVKQEKPEKPESLTEAERALLEMTLNIEYLVCLKDMGL